MQVSGGFRQWLLDPVLIIGVAASVATSIVYYEKSDSADSSFVVGLLLLIITLQIQLVLASKQRQIHETLHGRIVAAIERAAWFTEDIRRLLGYLEDLDKKFRGSPAMVTCKGHISRLVANVGQLSEGRIRLMYLDKEFAVNVTRGARKSLRAVTVEAANGEFWRTPVGMQYFAAQKEAVQRSVQIERVIVYREWSAALERVARNQADAGIRVFRVEEQRLAPDLRNNVAVWDDSCGFETEVNANGETIGYRLTVVDNEVNDLVRRYSSVWAIREEVPHLSVGGTDQGEVSTAAS